MGLLAVSRLRAHPEVNAAVLVLGAIHDGAAKPVSRRSHRTPGFSWSPAFLRAHAVGQLKPLLTTVASRRERSVYHAQ